MAARTKAEEEGGVKPGRREAAANSPRWSWRSTDLFESEEEAWMLVSRWRALERSEEYGLDEYGGERRDRRAQDRSRRA